MANQSIAETGEGWRIKRGIQLFRERVEEIIAAGDDFFIVPGSGEDSYVVDLTLEVCDCADYSIRLSKLPGKMVCKHIVAATIKRAKDRAKPGPTLCLAEVA